MSADRSVPRALPLPRVRSRHLASLASVAAAASLLAACGGGGGASSQSSKPSPAAPTSGPGGRLALKADPSGKLAYDRKTLQSKPGKVTIVMKNPSQLSHSVAIEGSGVNAAGEVVATGGTSTVSASLRPGTYTFFCTVPGHREAGMQGTLTVK